MAGPDRSVAQVRAPLLIVQVTGDGRVTSTPPGIDCGIDCSEGYPRNATGAPQVVTLHATPAAGQQLEAWGDACSGVGDCSVTMSADRTVTARFGPVPAPPPQASLTVAISAGGSVSGPGIACPGDCVESYPAGTTVPLSPAVQPEFAFAGWQGACSGAGTCAPAVSGATFVKSEFAPLRPTGPPLGAGRDADHDGLLDGVDRCPETPRRTTVSRNGCGVLDVLRDPLSVLDPVRVALDRARARLRYVPGAGAIVTKLRLGLRHLERGADEAAAGEVCRALGRIRKGASAMQGAVADAGKRITALQSDVFRTTLPAGFGDADDKDLRWAELHQTQAAVGDAGTRARTAAKAFAGACGALGHKFTAAGRVTELDDATGLLTIGGRRFLVPRKRLDNRIGAGSIVRITGKRAKGGPDLVSSVVPQVAAGTQFLPAKPCVSLRIAPLQDFSLPNPVLHIPRGYQHDGTLWLEAGTGVAASPKCASADAGRYSLAVELKKGGATIPVASDLTSDDTPVELPVGFSLSLWTLVVHERRQGSNCPPGGTQQARAAKSYPCPVVVIGKTEYPTRIMEQGDAGLAIYDQTTFSLDVDAPAPVKVTGFTSKHPSIPNGATVEAEGFKPTGNQTTGPIVVVKQGETFALWPKQVYGWDGILFALTTFGVEDYAGLYWPRVVGTRGGKPFRYSAKLPNLVTDRLASCAGTAPDCFYEPPWPFGVKHKVNQGNGPGFSHNGNQLYAFDFGLDDGDEIRAARGGVVGDVVINLTKNYNPCNPATPNADGLGNYVRIDHQDGTYAYYVHLKTNTSQLVVGQEIPRGALVAQADNTGRSCGAHLHFQVSAVKSQQYYGQTTPIRFRTWVTGQGPAVLECYLPVTGDELISTNS